MKKVLFVLLVVASINSYGQLQKIDVPKETTVGTVKQFGTLLSKLTYTVNNSDTTYTLRYNDASFKEINVYEDVNFKGSNSLINDLYNMLSTALDAEKGTETNFKLGETIVVARVEKTGGPKYLTIALSKKGGLTGLTNLTKKSIKNLFGKED